jgi:type VI secretion system ImpA family protein
VPQELSSRFADVIERFSAPIVSDTPSEDGTPPNPSGENIRKSDIYSRIRDLRYYPDPAETSADNIWKTKAKPEADWPQVVQLCEDVLLNQSKDVQVLGWYAEGLLNARGVLGLCQGLVIFSRVCDAHWETLHPIDEDGDMSYRLVTFNWLDSFVAPLVLTTALIPGAEGVRNLYDIEQRKSKSSEDGIKAQGELRQKFSQQPAPAVVDLYESVQDAIVALEELEPFVSDLAEQQNESASFIKLLKTLGSIIELCQDAYRIKKEEMSQPTFAQPAAGPFLGEEGGAAARPQGGDDFPGEEPWGGQEFPEGPFQFGEGGQIASSKEAYRLIQMANQYLLKHDPHSPCPFLVRRALSWRNKSLYELYLELFQSIEKPGDLFELLGLTDTDPKGRMS